MRKSACLMPTFSHFSSDTINGAKQGDPIRSLRESISFGRYVSDSLAQDNWPSFSHNRYLEEVEKYSKPGSVAEKKAYFEAHYKRIAAERAAALLQQENGAANNVSKPEAGYGIHNDTTYNHFADEEPQQVEAPSTEADSVGDKSKLKAEMDELEFTKLEVADLVKEKVLRGSHLHFESSIQLGEDENHSKITEIELNGIREDFPLKEIFTANQESLASPRKTLSEVSSSTSSVYSRASKHPSATAKSKSPFDPKKENNAIPSSKIAARNLDINRSTPKSLQNKSINSTSETNKTASPVIRKTWDSRVVSSSFKPSKDGLIFASVNGVPKHPSASPSLENNRTKTPFRYSTSGSRMVKMNWQSLSVDSSKSSSACRSKALSLTVVSPFSFKSDERAARRKEKLEEKINAEEAQQVLLQTKSKGRTENEVKRLQQSLGFKVKPMPNFNREIETAKNQIKKIQSTQPQSPNLGRKASPSTVQDTSNRPPWRPSVKSDGSQHVMEKNKRTPVHSISLPRKNTH